MEDAWNKFWNFYGEEGTDVSRLKEAFMEGYSAGYSQGKDDEYIAAVERESVANLFY